MTNPAPSVIRAEDLPTIRTYFAGKREAIGAAAFLELRQIQAVSDFDAWRAKWLTAADWTRLRVALRVRRHRAKHRGEWVRLSVGRATHAALQQRARQTGATINFILSQLIGIHP